MNRKSVMTFWQTDKKELIKGVLLFLSRDCRGEWKYLGSGKFKREGASEEWEKPYLKATLVQPMEDDPGSMTQKDKDKMKANLETGAIHPGFWNGL